MAQKIISKELRQKLNKQHTFTFEDVEIELQIRTGFTTTEESKHLITAKANAKAGNASEPEVMAAMLAFYLAGWNFDVELNAQNILDELPELWVSRIYSEVMDFFKKVVSGKSS